MTKLEKEELQRAVKALEAQVKLLLRLVGILVAHAENPIIKQQAEAAKEL